MKKKKTVGAVTSAEQNFLVTIVLCISAAGVFVHSHTNKINFGKAAKIISL